MGLIFWEVNVYTNAPLLKSEASYFEKFGHGYRPQWARKFKTVQAKKLVKSNDQFHEIFLGGNAKGVDSFDFTSFFGLDCFKFSGPPL